MRPANADHQASKLSVLTLNFEGACLYCLFKITMRILGRHRRSREFLCNDASESAQKPRSPVVRDQYVIGLLNAVDAQLRLHQKPPVPSSAQKRLLNNRSTFIASCLYMRLNCRSQSSRPAQKKPYENFPDQLLSCMQISTLHDASASTSAVTR
jgi:hypothetical protein